MKSPWLQGAGALNGHYSLRFLLARFNLRSENLLYKGLHFQILYLISSDLTWKYTKIPKDFHSSMSNAALSN